MKRKDSLASLFSDHGSYNLFGEDKELLGHSDDEENSVIPPKDVTRPSFVVGKGDSSSSLSTLSGDWDEIRMRSETRDPRNSLVVKMEGSRERLHSISLSDLFSRVGKPKIQRSRAELFERKQKSKVFEKVPQVSIKYIFLF